VPFVDDELLLEQDPFQEPAGGLPAPAPECLQARDVRLQRRGGRLPRSVIREDAVDVPGSLQRQLGALWKRFGHHANSKAKRAAFSSRNSRDTVFPMSGAASRSHGTSAASESARSGGEQSKPGI